MKVTKIHVNYGITKNLGNYESLRLDYALDMDLDEGDVPYSVLVESRTALRLDLQKAIAEEVPRWRKK